MKNVIKYENEPRMRNFLLNRYLDQENEFDYTSRIRRIYQFLSKKEFDLVIDAAQKTMLEHVELNEALKITKLLAEAYVLNITYNAKESAIYVELKRYRSRGSMQRQEIA